RSATPPGEWVALTGGEHWETAPQFSPDGKLVYFTSDRDAWRCIWAQRVHSTTGQPDRDPFAVHHMHTARRSPALVPLNAIDMFVGANRIVLGMGELTGSIWLAKPSN
ncbi:MAG: PD40 domain-containing protein, partial [Acidobacteria bacterium]|nr:PD40 domain-containing protein [Acidobacteriota bacterium]